MERAAGGTMNHSQLRIESSASSIGEPILVEDYQSRYGRPQSISIQSSSLNKTMSSPHSPDDEAQPPDISRRKTQVPVRPRSSMGTEPRGYREHYLLDLPASASSRSNSSLRIDPQSYRDSQGFGVPSSVSSTPESPNRSSTESEFSVNTADSSIHTLPPLQNKGLPDEVDRLDPLEEEDDPHSFDLVAAAPDQLTGVYQLEKSAELLLSSTHLKTIFSESKWLMKFTTFLHNYRPQSIPILIFYLDAVKALRALSYANAISEALEPIKGFKFTEEPPHPTRNLALQEKADQAFEALVREDLPAYIVHVWVKVVSVSIQRRITGTLPPHLREASEGLAEVFCLSDPSRADNPIVFASQEFHRTTQYGMNYAIGRNCRFLQGPRTSPHSVRRLAEACKASKEHSEMFVNYRRDGSPFVNLLMVAPLFDSKGVLRYFIGAQVDVSGLLKDATDLEAFRRVLAREEDPKLAAEEDADNQKDEFQNLSEMFNVGELETVRNCGGRMHREQVEDSDAASITSYRPRLLLKNSSPEPFDDQARPSTRDSNDTTVAPVNGRLEGVYQHYLLVRPAPSLRILFTSPTLRVPGILQSPFLSRIGGSPRVRRDLEQAMSEGRGVTAKIRWLTRASEDGEGDGRSRWIHATPLYSHSGSVGVWMVVLVDEESAPGDARRRFRAAPPVSTTIGGKEYDARASRAKRESEATNIERLVPRPIRVGNSERDRNRPQQRIASMDRKTAPSVRSESELSFHLK